jgi:hypothetical protein
MWFKGVKLSKEGILALVSAIERTTLEPKRRDQAHASSTCKVCIALAAIANLLAPWEFWSGYVRLSTYLTIECTTIERMSYDRLHVGLRLSAPHAIERTPDLAAC